MKVVARLAVLVYVTAFLFIGCVIGLFVLRVMPLLEVIQTLSAIYTDHQLRLVFGLVALIILFMNYIFARSIAGHEQQGKIIAFDNPGGRVSVSLRALEDLVRRVIARSPEVKDVYCSITASKRRLDVQAKLVLTSEVNIPEMTSNLQETIKSKIQDTIGIDETVVVRLHIVKMISPHDEMKRRKEDSEGDAAMGSTIPFQGYRA